MTTYTPTHTIDAVTVEGHPTEPVRALSWSARGCKVRLRKSLAGTYTTTISNGFPSRISTVDIRLDDVTFDAGPVRITSPCRGGEEYVILKDWEPGNSSVWPGQAYSPIVTAWNKTGAVGITAFNKHLIQTQIFWSSGSDRVLTPFVRYMLDLEPGQSVTLTCTVREYATREAHWRAYRRTLAAFMTPIISEAECLVDGAIIQSFGTTDMAADAALCKARGAGAIIMWAPPDGRSEHYNPDPTGMRWLEQFPSASDTGLKVGSLINPFRSPHIPAVTEATLDGREYTNLSLDLRAPRNREYLTQMREELVSRGVTLAFWDTGSGHTWAWLELLIAWRLAGIRILCETSCDVAAWVTGLWMEYPYSWGEYDLPRVVTPKARLYAHTNFTDPRGDWVADATKKGVGVIVNLDELRRAR